MKIKINNVLFKLQLNIDLDIIVISNILQKIMLLKVNKILQKVIGVSDI